MNERQIMHALSEGRCPDCRWDQGFVFGPRGGAAINIECGNPACRHRFNVTPYGGEVVMAQRIESEAEGGSDWWLLKEPYVAKGPFPLSFLHNPPNVAPIKELYAFLSTDADGNEGIVASIIEGLGATTLVTGKASNAELMKGLARQVARQSGKAVRLIKFHAGETLWSSDDKGERQ